MGEDGTTSLFRGLFIGPADLPQAMRCVRDAREADISPPGDTPGGRPSFTRAGWEIWFGPADSDLYRVDDVRWLYRSEAEAQDAYCGEVHGVAGSKVATIERPGFRCAGFATNDSSLVHLLSAGTVVARLRAMGGEGTPLPHAAARSLVDVIALRLSLFCAAYHTPSAETWWQR